MTTTYQIIPSENHHVAMLADALREADAREITCMGVSVRKAVWRSYRNATLRKTAFIGGEIAAMWGLGGCILDAYGTPWLLTTPAVEKIPVAFVKEARREVRKMLEVKPRLVNFVDASYTRAVRLLEMLGFALGQPEPKGPNGALFRRFEMRAAR